MKRPPSHWREERLGHLFRNRRENGPPGLPTLSVTMNDGLVPREDLERDLERKTESKLTHDQHLLVREGDIAYNMMRMWQGACGLATCAGNVSPAYVVVEPTADIDARFACYWFKSHLGRYRLWAYSHGLTEDRLRLYFDDFAQIPIDLPSPIEQRRIADALSVWDRAIETSEALVAAKRRRRLGYLQRRVFGARLIESDLAGSSLTQKRLAGSNDWPMREIGDVATEISRLNRAGEDLPVLSCTKRAGVVLSAEYFSGRRVHAEDTSGYKIVQRGEFVYATNHLEEGSIGLQNLTDAGVVSPMYTVFSVDDTLIDRDFLFAVLKTETYRQVFQINTAASVDRRGGLRWDEFAALPFALPPLSEQRAIATALQALDKDIAAEVARMNALRTQRRGLIQKLLTGKWRLSSDASEQAA